jgi:hypothetical protein
VCPLAPRGPFAGEVMGAGTSVTVSLARWHCETLPSVGGLGAVQPCLGTGWRGDSWEGDVFSLSGHRKAVLVMSGPWTCKEACLSVDVSTWINGKIKAKCVC